MSGGDFNGAVLSLWDGVPYVAYLSREDGSLPMVKAYQNSQWNVVGSGPVTDSLVNRMQFKVRDGIPYFGMVTGARDNFSMMKFENGQWDFLGDSVINELIFGLDFDVEGQTAYVTYDGEHYGIVHMEGQQWVSEDNLPADARWVRSASVDVVNGIPYIIMQSGASGARAIVIKYESGVWDYVGDTGGQGFSSGRASNTNIVVDQDIPFVSFRDDAVGNRALVMRYFDAEKEILQAGNP
jgi:hypothetical protein